MPLIADVLSEDDLNRGRLHLFERGEDGINLIRLHGALDVFTFRDGLDLCRLCPINPDLNGILKPLEMLNEQIAYWEHGTKVRVVNELAYADGTGTLQFLRRTLLAGAQKFNQRFVQTLPHKMLDIFRNNIGHVTKLYCVGYSFGDAHVDAVLRLWLEQSGKRKLTIVSPGRKDIPAQLAHLALQIQLKPQCASEFFADYRTSPLTLEEQAILKIRAMNRDAIELKVTKKW